MPKTNRGEEREEGEREGRVHDARAKEATRRSGEGKRRGGNKGACDVNGKQGAIRRRGLREEERRKRRMTRRAEGKKKRTRGGRQCDDSR